MANNYNESDLERAVMEWLKGLGWQVGFGPEVDEAERENLGEVVLVGRLRAAVDKINPEIPAEAREEAVKKVLNAGHLAPDLIEANHAFHKMMVEGVDVEYRRPDGSVAGDKVYLVDFKNFENNDWLAVNQFTVIENRVNRRPDVVLFVNGLPLGVFELKNPASEDAGIKNAFNQIQTYKKEIPSIFVYNEICLLADHIKNALAGTAFADFDRFMGWKSVDGNVVCHSNDLEILVKGIFDRQRFLDIARNFIVFEAAGGSINAAQKLIKKMAAYHQYFAVNKAIESTLRAAASLPAHAEAMAGKVGEAPAAYGLADVSTQPKGDRRAGVVWHTQGSGKSLSMVFYAGKLIQVLDNPTLVVLTDRNDLDGQLFGVFANCAEIIRQTPKQAESRTDLKKLLAVASGGVVFTTIQKFFFGESGERANRALSERKNIVVIADEAHRSQYDFIDGFARNMRDALPNATFIGFTGTPIELSDKNTRAVFGNYVDVYDIARAVEDKATVPIYYEARLAKIDLLKQATPKIDQEFEELTEGEETAKVERLKSKWARLEAMIGSEKRIKMVASDIVDHFEKRLSALEGKGIIVAMSRRIAVELYEEIIKLRPEWHSDNLGEGFIKVVMTGKADDPQKYQPHIHSKEDRDALAARFKDPQSGLKLVIVRDMWLTGFDAPCLHTMYIDKPMQGHGLMQAIARVNRIYKDKPGGLVVDYLGIAPSLKYAVTQYTQSGSGQPTIDQKQAIDAMIEKYEAAKAIYQGFEYSGYFAGGAAQRAEIAGKAMDHILGLKDGKKRYAKAVAELSKAFSLSIPSIEAIKIRDEVAFFQTVNAFIAKFDSGGGLGGPTMEDYDQAIRQIVANAVATDKVISVFDAAGLESPDIAVLSDEFLSEVQGLERKNVALEVLRKLLNDEIRAMEKKFLVKSRSFGKMLEDTVKRYQNQTIEAAQVIAELVELAKKIRDEKNRGVDLKLNEDEVAFYDALCENESAVRELGDETLKKIAQELVIMLRKNTSIDWTLKESVRAKLRIYVKKLLNKYKYPPDRQEQATVMVLEQAELICADWTGE